MKYEHIRRWTQRYDDWLKKNNHDPEDYVTKRWLRDEIDELRECIEEIQFPRWVGLTPEEREECIAWAHDLDSTDFSKYLAKMIEYKLKEKNA